MEFVTFTPQQLYPRFKSPWHPLDRRLGGNSNLSDCDGEEKNSQPLPGLEHSIIQPVDQRYTTELSRLLHIVLYYIILYYIILYSISVFEIKAIDYSVI
jgi:hypothetical protein